MPEPVHADLFDNAAAVAFLRLDTACPTPAAATAALHRLAKRAGVKPLSLGKTSTWHRTHLEAIVAHELAQQTQ